jgi:hypothetical protein
MAKGAGIVALILGIVSLTPVPFFIALSVPFLLYILPIASIVLGIVGVATAKGDSKAPGVLGIVFGAIGLILNITLWPILMAFFLVGSLLGGLGGLF